MDDDIGPVRNDRPTSAEIVAANPLLPWAEPMPLFACRVCCMSGNDYTGWISIHRERVIEHLREKHGL